MKDEVKAVIIVVLMMIIFMALSSFASAQSFQASRLNGKKQCTQIIITDDNVIIAHDTLRIVDALTDRMGRVYLYPDAHNEAMFIVMKGHLFWTSLTVVYPCGRARYSRFTQRRSFSKIIYR